MRGLGLLILSLIVNIAVGQSTVCSNLVDLGTLPSCQATIYSNSNSDISDIGNDNFPSCWSSDPAHDVWFTFVVAPDITDYTIQIDGINNNGTPIRGIQAAIYRGFCAFDAMAIRDCSSAESQETSLQFDLINVTPNQRLFLRIDNQGGASANGEFTLCIDEVQVEYTVDQFSAEECTGTLYDTGGSTENYGDNENHIFTICPNSVHSCLRFDLEYYNVEEGTEVSGDKIIFYNGDNTQSDILSILGKDNGFGTAHGGGGVCHSVFADDCLTVQFISDGSISFEGFKGKWSCSITPCAEINPIAIQNNTDPETIVDALSTPLTQVTIDTIICPDGGYGVFESPDISNLGLSKGLLLTTGSPFNALGPNNQLDATTQNNGPGDNDLDILSFLSGNEIESFDACVVELDVFAISDELTFDYIFGSEEYPEFANTEFNDIFALLISGPGIEGNLQIGNQKNMAVLPGSNNTVEINSVNHINNWEYYRNNAFGKAIEYDGLTTGKDGVQKSLTASQEVIPCNSYHLKFAIADRGDSEYDSGVFIGEITSGLPRMETNFTANVDFLVEGCATIDNTVRISVNDPVSDNLSFSTVISGTARKDIDYTTNLPQNITFTNDQLDQEYTIATIADQESEVDEDIIIQLYSESPCGTFLVDELIIPLREKVDVILPDSMVVCKNANIDIQAMGASQYDWSPIVFVDNPSPGIATVFGDQNRWYTVIGSIPGFNDEACIDVDSIWVEVVEPDVSIINMDTEMCTGDTIRLSMEPSHHVDSYQWNSNKGTFLQSDNQSTAFIATASDSLTLIAGQAYIGGCWVSDSILVSVDDFYFPFVPASDTICQGETLRLGSDDLNENTRYTWSPNTSISSTTSSRVTISPQESTTYRLLATSQNKYCSDSTDINVSVIPNEINLESSNSLLCINESTRLTSTFTAVFDDPRVIWYDRNNTPIAEGVSSLDLMPQVSGNYFIELINGSCIARDTVFIRVDSIPSNVEIDIFPQKDLFCKGEEVVFITPPVSAQSYPNIEYQWELNGRITTALDNLNVGILSDSTRTYVRRIVNGACTSENTVTIDVLDLDLEVILNKESICKGDSLGLTINANQELGFIDWDLSGECIDPSCMSLVTTEAANNNTVYIEYQECKDTLNFEVNVGQLETMLEVEPDTLIALDTEVILTSQIISEEQGDYSYSWCINGQEITGEIDSILIHRQSEMSSDILSKVISASGCADSTSVRITAVKPEIIFPNAFVPDSDNPNNSNFKYFLKFEEKNITTGNLNEVQFKIYNRWGQEVFACENVNCAEEGWNGTNNGKRSPAEVYTYYFSANWPDGETVDYKGTFTLIR